MSGIKFLFETRDTVTLRRTDFKNLVEAAETAQDLTAVAAHRTYEGRVGWEVARRNYLTGEETRRLLDGESPVRVWREKRGLTQRVLAQAARISASYLAEIESGKKPGSAEAVRRIADVLNVPMDFLAENTAEPLSADGGPIPRSDLAARHLLSMAESNPSPDDLVVEARVILTELLDVAERNGLRHQVRATVEALIETLQAHMIEISNTLIPIAHNQDQNKNIGAQRRLVRASMALEKAIHFLRGESRKL